MRVVLLWVAVGCSGETSRPRPPVSPNDTEETGLSTTGTTGNTGVTGDTGTPGPIGWPEWPICSRTPQTQAVTLLADQADDEAGRYIDVADVDIDGCAEVLVSAHRPYGWWDLDIDTASYLLREPWLAGGLEEHAFAIFEGPPTGYDEWSLHNVFLTASEQVAIGGAVYAGDLYAAHIHDLHTAVQGSRPTVGDAVARIWVPNPYTGFGIPGDLSDCASMAGTPRLCVGTISSDPAHDYSGQVLAYDAPLSGDIHVLDDARSQIVGDDGERAQMVLSRADFDGDGRDDLLVGAYEALSGAGRIGLITELPDGYHRLWDITAASIGGTVPGAELGLSMATGDLDSDGYVDLFAGAPVGNEAYVVRGPLVGDRPVSTASWRISGTDPLHWTGSAGAMADIDGDGQDDLAVGVPYWPYLTDAPPGFVALWSSPLPGNYTVDQAQRTVSLGGTRPDAFGQTLAAGDIDGDGLSDLAIGAPRDSAAGEDAGSITLVFGASL